MGFVLFEWNAFPKQGKQVSHYGIVPYARSILTPQLTGIKPGNWLNTKQPRRPNQIGIQPAPGETRACVMYCLWSNPGYSANNLEAILSLQVIPYPQIPPSQQLGLQNPLEMGVVFSIFEVHPLNLVRINISLSSKNTKIFVVVCQVLSDLAKISVSVFSIS